MFHAKVVPATSDTLVLSTIYSDIVITTIGQAFPDTASQCIRFWCTDDQNNTSV